MTPALQELAGRFQLLQLQITLQLQQDSELPAFKGSMWHGWFGQLLKNSDEHAYFVCFGNHDQRQPKPYWLRPSGDHKTHWSKGELIQFELMLAGSSTELAPAIINALQTPLGLGPKRTPVSLISVASVTPHGLEAGLCTVSLLDHVVGTNSAVGEMALQLHTPMRIKHQGKVLNQAPPALPQWLNLVLRRLTQLSRFWVCDDQALIDAVYQYPLRLGEYQQQHYCHFEDWRRYSRKEQTLLPFGGLKGQVSFCGEIGHAKPLLQLGQVLHLGSKTTFGLGHYQLIS